MRPVDERVKLCDCAVCGRTLLGETMVGVARLGEFRDLPYVYSRIHGRPVCEECFHKLQENEGCKGQQQHYSSG